MGTNKTSNQQDTLKSLFTIPEHFEMGFEEVTLKRTFASCSCVDSSTERRGERVEVFGATGGATILNIITRTDRTTCGRRLPVAMVLITRWRKCIQAVRIAPDVIHTFIPHWKSAQMFNMLEKMSQKPEKSLRVK